jgi:hypothetical protein
VSLIAAASIPTAGIAQPLALGPEFQINTYTSFPQRDPSVAVDAAGNFVAVWHSYGSSGLDSDSTSIQGQRFDASGAPLGTEFQINSCTTSDQLLASVAAHPSYFVVVWTSLGSSGSDSANTSIQAQLFDASGDPSGTEFQINSYTTGAQREPRVAIDASGNFFVVWTSSASSGTDSDNFSVQGRLFDGSGAPLSNDFQINTVTGSVQRYLNVAADPSGNFVVVWQSFESDGAGGYSQAVSGQRFDSTGARLGFEFKLNTYTPNAQVRPSVATDASGNFVTVWASAGLDSSYYSVQGQRFDSSGAPQGTEFQVNTYTTGSQDLPSVAVDASGGFVVVWQSVGSSGSDTDPFSRSVQGQSFDAAGVPLGTEFQINTYPRDIQGVPSVVADAAGHFVVVWHSKGSNDDFDYSIQGQRFSAEPLCACGDATCNSSISASDALLALKTAVGSGDCLLCICDVNSSGSINTTDALLVLKKGVGQEVNLVCIAC